jgi:hypothetical protein
VDANLGNTLIGRSPKPQTGYLILCNGSLVSWKSAAQRHVAKSSLKAETNAAYEAVDRLIVLRLFLSSIGLRHSATLLTDSRNLLLLLSHPNPTPAEQHLVLTIRNLKGLVERGLALETEPLVGKTLDRELDTTVLSSLCLRDMMTENEGGHTDLRFISGKGNPADLLTKPGEIREGIGRRVMGVGSAVAFSRGSFPPSLWGEVVD